MPYTKYIKQTTPMTVQVVKHSFYRIEIDFPETTKTFVYFRKEGKCTSFTGADRQMNRVTNEVCDEWREFGFRRITVARVPANEVTI